MEKQFQSIKVKKIVKVFEELEKQNLIDNAGRELLQQHYDRYMIDKVRGQVVKHLETTCEFHLIGINEQNDLIIYALLKNEDQDLMAKIYFRRRRMEVRTLRI